MTTQLLHKLKLPVCMAALCTLTITGCLRPQDYRRQADRTSYDIIEQTQAASLGRTEPFTIEKPADTLRRRLMLDQQLPRASNASLGASDIEPIKQWPNDNYLEKAESENPLAEGFSTAETIQISLNSALQIAAQESREYQTQKESVFEAALRLDLERDDFRFTWAGVLSALVEADLEQLVTIDDEGRTDFQTVSGVEYGGTANLSKQFKNGLSFTGLIGLDLVSLLTQNRMFSRGVFADVTVSIPLMRGSGEFVVTEPLTQAERDVVYAIYDFERFKREFAVQVANDYLGLLRQEDQIKNEEENYRGLITSTRRARRLADAGRLDEIQVDQSLQDELRARNRWVAAVESYERRLDSFKLRLGLPTDARIEPDYADLEKLSNRADRYLAEVEDDSDTDAEAPTANDPIVLVPPGQGGPPGPLEMDETEAVLLALDQRLDLRIAVGQVFDAQRTVAVAADQLRADVTLLGSGSAGQRRTLQTVGLDDSKLKPDEGLYSALLTVNLPFERTFERNTYRVSLIRLEQAVRAAQDLEDQVKLDVRNRLSELLEARETIQIQAQSVVVAKRRVESTNLFLEAGRAEIRDVLEAQESLVSAQNTLTAALVSYRIGELSLQRDLGVLEVSEQGLWQEYTP